MARLGSDLNTPVKVALDLQGNLWITEHHGDRVAELSPTGTLLRRFGGTGREPGRFDHPNGIAFDAAGNLYVADHHNDRVQKLSQQEQPLGEWSVRKPLDVAVDPAGNVYASRDGDVVKLSPSGAVLAHYGGFSDPRGIALDANGNLYVGETDGGKILKLSPSGQILRTYGAGVGAAPGQIKVPADVAVDPAGNVYVAEGDPEDGSGCNCRVQKFSPTGELLAVWR